MTAVGSSSGRVNPPKGWTVV
uniref:Uncharacterized protein n=1 Tax=Arundo donax TaxID=35708 RepID=A0A0A9FTY6_ARUDO